MSEHFRDIIARYENNPTPTRKEINILIKRGFRKQGVLICRGYINGYLVWRAGGREYKTLEEAAHAYGIVVPELADNCLTAN